MRFGINSVPIDFLCHHVKLLYVVRDSVLLLRFPSHWERVVSLFTRTCVHALRPTMQRQSKGHEGTSAGHVRFPVGLGWTAC